MKNTLRKIISLLLAFEGIAHWVFPGISLWGMWKAGIWDWAIAATPLMDIFFGVVCLLGSYFLGIDHHRH